MNKITLIIALLAFFSSVQAQTKVNLPIESSDPYKVFIWTYNEEIDSWGWYDIQMTNIERNFGWIYNQEVKALVEPFDIMELMFIRGFGHCRDTTRVTIHGSYEKEIVKDKRDYRRVIRVDGSHQTFGVPIERP
jgi:hypothetical protein